MRAVALLGTKLGITAFGGPAAHIAMLRQEVVDRRQWMQSQHFLDLIGITNLIPGPNSTEMVMHVGYEQAGRRGLLAAGLAFILPAASITLAFAVAYERYGETPAAGHLLSGIKPVIVAVVLQAVWRLGQTAVTKPVDLAVVIAVAALFISGISELVLLFGVGVGVTLISAAIRRLEGQSVTALIPVLMFGPLTATSAADGGVPYTATRLFLQFLKIGALLYGSGYVLIAFLHSTFVDKYGWLTEAQLIDAVAVGQVTPGPVFTTATFIGYLVGGFPGAILATAAIFLPSFLFVAAANPLLPRIRSRELLGELLDGINLAAIGLMLGVTWYLGREALVDPTTAIVAAAAALLLVWKNVNSAALLGLGAVVGLITAAI
ncbi:chromate efflux transporter [soil metagenome]